MLERNRRYRPFNAYLSKLLSGGLIAATLGGATSIAKAGDMLRGGYTPNSSQAANPTSFTPPSVSKARANMQDALARATQVIDAVQQMQSSARAIAAASTKNNLGINPNNPSLQLPTVPNGLGVGGLNPATGLTWTGATQPSETMVNGRTVVTVDQTSPEATLTWTTFNIGKSTTLKFDQSKTGTDTEDSIAFNIVEDPSGVPSQILGAIQALGQVYVINQNGIIFGGASQINVHALVASSLPINNYLVGVGLANDPDDQYLFSSLSIPALTNKPTAPTFTPPPAPNTPNGQDGDVIVEAGALLESPANADGVGGKIALVGPNVTNAGTILTPDGQTILAAGQQVGFLPHAESDPSLRGLDVFVGAGGGEATNSGDIVAPEADVTMVGASIQQLGAIESTTSVTLNGRIDLNADSGTKAIQSPEGQTELVTTEAGTVTFGASSLTEILPDVDSSATITSAEPPPNQSLALASQVNVQGESIHLAGNAELLAPSANVTMEAGAWLPIGNGAYSFEYTKGQIYLDSGALINVAGSEDVSASVTQNIIAVQLLGPELADSPLERNSGLYGQTIYVDIRDQGTFDGTAWIGTPLADAFGYADLVQYTVGELTTNGGKVNMQAGGSVVMQQGSQVDVSGGWIDYSGGVVSTSDLISGGNIYPISEATPDLLYSGFLPQYTQSSQKWGTTASYSDPLITSSHYEDGYVYGGNGGSVAIVAPATALDGTLLGLTENGPRQVGPNSLQAAPSSITLAFEGQNASNSPLFPTYSPTPPTVIFSTEDNLPAAAPFTLDSSGNPATLGADRTAKVILSPDLFTTDGFGALTVRDGDGNIIVPTGVTLNPGDAGSITLQAANLNIEGSIIAPGGSIDLTVYDYSPYSYQLLITEQSPATPPVNALRGNFILGSSASLDVAGLLIDDRSTALDADTTPLDTTGGSVSIASYNVNLQAGSSIDVSGGIELNTKGAPLYGNAGSISILAGNDPEIASLLGGHLKFDAELLGFSGAEGGSLTVQAPRIQIGGDSAAADVLLLSPGFFDQGGFGSFTLDALGGVDKTGASVPAFSIAAGTDLTPIVESLIALPYAPGGAGLQATTNIDAVGYRTPVSLAFDAEGVTDKFTGAPIFLGSFVMGQGATIETDPLGKVSINGGTVAILGSIDAPGGQVSISGGDTASGYGELSPTEALPTVYISLETTISTAGETIYSPNNEGYITGSVLAGGKISVSGNIVAEAGAILNVSGASNTLDESPTYSSILGGLNGENTGTQGIAYGSFRGELLVPTLIESNGGSITLKGTEELFSDATLIGESGGSEALGGALGISSGEFNSTPGNPLPPSNVTLIVSENGLTIGGAAPAPGETALGHEVLDSGGNIEAQLGHIAVQSFANGGFDSINLNGTVEFSGPVSISAGESITVATSGFLYANGAVTLTAPFVSLGTAFQSPTPIDQESSNPPISYNGTAYFSAPTYGTGSLTVNAQLIDVGNLSLQGIGNLRLIADGGDIQGDGTLDVAGNVYLRAGQIYPPTETTFTIAAYNYTDAKGLEDGSITIAVSGQLQLPLSAGGTLNLYATDITQDGVLRAPFGTINLGWNGTGTAPIDPLTGKGVDAAGNVTLGAGSVTSVSAIDPITGQGITIPYGIVLNGVSWIDPSGVDITSVGAPQKAINISGQNVTEASGATIDIRGGGDLLGYEFVSGVGGDIDILNTTTSYAIVPGYSANYAPYAPFNSDRPTGSTELANLGSDPGYVNKNLAPGDTIYLSGGSGLPAGTYTLLPARYATLPGAYLVSAVGGIAGPGGLQPDGASIVPGYRIGTGQTIVGNFEVESPSVLSAEADYEKFSGTEFLGGNSLARTPADSGQLNLEATQALNLEGSVLSTPLAAGAAGGLVDIDTSAANIFIAGPGEASSAPSGYFVLNSIQLSSIGAQTLLIGGVATTGANGTTITTAAETMEIDNAGSTLSGGDVILVANNLILDKNASVTATGPSDDLALSITGDGALLRVSDDASAGITRTGVDSTGAASLTVDAGARLSGAGVILDSSQTSVLDATAVIDAKAVTIDSGLISIALDNSGTPAGLVLSGDALQQIANHTNSLTLLSYSAIDIYGTGEIGAGGALDNLTLSATEINGFDQGSGTVTFAAKNITLSGVGTNIAAATGTPSGTLAFEGNVIHLGNNSLQIGQYSAVELNGATGIVAEGAGSVTTQGNLTLTAPLITGAAGSKEIITAAGAVDILGTTTAATVQGGLAASLSITGASIDDNSNIELPTGTISLQATSGDIVIGDAAESKLSTAGTVRDIFDLTEYTGGGTINLTANEGNVTVAQNGTVDVSAPNGGGNAGTLNVNALQGSFDSTGTLLAQGGAGGNGGNFSLKTDTLPTYSALESILSSAGFNQSVQIEVANGNVTVDGNSTEHQFDLTADAGSIFVTGEINASGETGGEITLAAAGSVTLENGSVLDASAPQFNDAGKGGSVTLSAGSDINGSANTSAEVDIAAGSTIDLTVASNSASSANLGDFSGTLLIRAPQTADGSNVQVAPIDGAVTGASAIVVEGYRIYDLTSTGGQITPALESQIYNDGVTFLGAAGQTASNYTAMYDGLVGNSGLTIYIETGAEIINQSGDLTLGSSTSNSSSDWDLENFRFGPDGTAGQLTLRASGDIVFYNSLSDGFQGSTNSADLLLQNAALPANIQSWSYTLTAGADLASANTSQVIVGNGSLELGKNDPAPYANGGTTGAAGSNAETSKIINGFYQVIRTGAGDIRIAAGGSVELLNQFATIYTAGTQVLDPTLNNTFELPEGSLSLTDNSSNVLGAPQETPIYQAQYSEAGGNVSITAGEDIAHLTQNSSGQLVEDSELELPNNWLDRRGYYVDSATGQLTSGESEYGDSASTSWWVDFQNFFEGVGALGGGNVTLTAGHDVANVDAVAPTNARMPAGPPSIAALVELGGGDVAVTAGNNINAGVYYVERGQGSLTAGNDILTNSTRSATVTDINASFPADSEDAWLPTTLFLGKGDFIVTAAENITIGPVANVFLLPQSINNTFWYKSYFSTYDANDAVDITSLGGNVTLRESATPNGQDSAIPLLENWLNRVQLFANNAGDPTVSYYEPWLRLDESSVSDFKIASSIMPPTLDATALEGDVDTVGNITLSPSPAGTLDLVAAGSINAVQPNGVGSDASVGGIAWDQSTINISDASPDAIPGITDPFAYESIVGISRFSDAYFTGVNLLRSIDALFTESGETGESLQQKEVLHGRLPNGNALHSGNTTPVDLYAGGGDISGLTLFSPEETRVIAGGNITDISLYIQNEAATDISVISAGRDIIAYDPDSVLRTEAEEPGNFFGSPFANAGDIQIGGPGTLEVLAGNNLELGVGPNYSSSTGVGITSIGNQRDPFLSAAGADVIAAGGMGPLTELSTSNLGFSAFIDQFVTGPESAPYLAELSSISTDTLAFSGAAGFNQLSKESQDIVALDVFFLVLRDAGRDHNAPTSAGFGNYAAADEAIADLFPHAGTNGDISLTSREISTENGGNISILDPSGELTVGFDIAGNQPLDQGIFTEDGGNISIYTDGSIIVGTSRIFTLRGGNEILWSSQGNIAAGESPKTVQEAPPTQVIVDPQSANVQTDLGGLATGGGIGVLASVQGVPAGNVDLIAPNGVVDAGDAGIRVTGNLNIAAVQVLNAGNIDVGGASAGVPVSIIVAPNVAGLTAAANSAGAGASEANQAASNSQGSQNQEQDVPSIVNVQVLGYGGGDDSD